MQKLSKEEENEMITKRFFLEVLNERDKSFNKRFDLIDKRFVFIDRKFDLIDKRFDLIDRKFDLIDKRFNKIDLRFEEIDLKFDYFYKRFDLVDKDFATKKYLDETFSRYTGILIEEMTDRIKGMTEGFLMKFEKMDSDTKIQNNWLSNHEDRILKLET